MNHDDRQERISDPVLSAAMAELRGELPHDVDWNRLRRSINSKAEMSLARKRVSRRVLLPKSLVPLAAAATIAFSLWLGPSIVESFRAPSSVQASATVENDEILEEALGGDLTEQEFRLLVTGRADPEALLAFAIEDR